MNINFYVIANLYKNDIINRVGCQGLYFEYFSTEIRSFFKVYPKSTLIGVELIEYFYGVSLVSKCL